MSEVLNKTMLDSWRKYWGTDDDEGLQAAAIHAKAWLGEGVPWQGNQ